MHRTVRELENALGSFIIIPRYARPLATRVTQAFYSLVILGARRGMQVMRQVHSHFWGRMVCSSQHDLQVSGFEHSSRLKELFASPQTWIGRLKLSLFVKYFLMSHLAGL
jgi:hypothetical protein